MLKLEFDPRVMEEAVIASLRVRPRAGFWRERESLYRIEDQERREWAFQDFHRRSFESLGLVSPVHQALRESPIVLDQVGLLRILFAGSRREEDAELFVKREGPGAAETRAVVLRLRPQAFCEPAGLLWFLRRELLRITDMLDPEFGYDPCVPAVEGGPLRLKIVLARYRVLWDTVIDGRLSALGRAPADARSLRFRDFARALELLHDRLEAAFDSWFRAAAPTHSALWAYALDPARGEGSAPGTLLGRGVCPLCQCPGALRSLSDGVLPAQAAARLKSDFPDWTPAQGLCGQCEDLYRNRVGA